MKSYCFWKSKLFKENLKKKKDQEKNASFLNTRVHVVAIFFGGGSLLSCCRLNTETDPRTHMETLHVKRVLGSAFVVQWYQHGDCHDRVR